MRVVEVLLNFPLSKKALGNLSFIKKITNIFRGGQK
jgi:hypothetical protein